MLYFIANLLVLSLHSIKLFSGEGNLYCREGSILAIIFS